MSKEYAKAYVEVLEILKTLKKEDLNKIPKERLELYDKNKDSNYKFHLDRRKPIKEQISNEAQGVLANLYDKFLSK